MPRSPSKAAVRSVSHGCDDEVSSTSAPGARAGATSHVAAFDERLHDHPPFGTIVTTMSLRAASSAGEFAPRAHAPPASVGGDVSRRASGRDVVAACIA